MRWVSAIFALCFASVPGASGDEGALNLCEERVFPAYYQKVDDVIDDAVGRESSLWVTVYPSFEPEWGVRFLDASNGRASPEIVVVEFDKSVWSESIVQGWFGRMSYDFDRPSIVPTVSRVAISDETFATLTDAFKSAASNAIPRDIFGYDGTTYIFQSSLACAETWSPTSGEALLSVHLLEAIAKLSQQSELERVEGERRINVLANKLRR